AIDGARPWRQFWHVTVPNLRPTIIFTVIVSTIGGLQLFTEPYLFEPDHYGSTGGSARQYQTVVMYLYEKSFGSSQFKLGYASAIGWALFMLIALISVVNSAVSAYPPVLTPGGELWHNITRLFNSGEVNVDFWKALSNSTIVAGTVSAAVVFFSALAGFAFAKLEFRGRKMLLLAVIATMLVPVQLGVIPLYIEMKDFGWTNHLQAVIAPNLASAYGVSLMRQYIVGAVPNELIDASRVDGCHTLRVFWHVVLPAVRPVPAVP